MSGGKKPHLYTMNVWQQLSSLANRERVGDIYHKRRERERERECVREKKTV
jgi:hypothetical protein